jgi:hypothetical protein
VRLAASRTRSLERGAYLRKTPDRLEVEPTIAAVRPKAALKSDERRYE